VLHELEPNFINLEQIFLGTKLLKSVILFPSCVLYIPLYVIMVIKLRIVIWVGRIARIGVVRSA